MSSTSPDSSARKQAPLALEFSNVSEQPTGDKTAYSFVVSGEHVAAYGRVFRHADAPGGVQRGKKKKTVDHFKQCMLKGNPLPQSMLANLGGDWEVGMGKLIGDEGMTLDKDPKSYLEMIDGQHRMIACQELIDEGHVEAVRRYSFTVIAFIKLAYEERLRLFMSQFEGQKLDSNFAITLRSDLKEFATDTDRHAWAIVEELNTHPQSPIKGRVHMGETQDENRRTSLKPGEVKAASLLMALKPITSKQRKNPLFNLAQDDRRRLVLNAFIAASKTFSNFGDVDHTLGTILGYSALIAVISMDGEVSTQLRNNGYTLENLLAIFGKAKRFHWTPRSDVTHKSNKTPYGIAQRLNDYIRSR